MLIEITHKQKCQKNTKNYFFLLIQLSMLQQIMKYLKKYPRNDHIGCMNFVKQLKISHKQNRRILNFYQIQLSQNITLYLFINIKIFQKSTLHKIPLNPSSQNTMNIALFTKSWPRHNHNSNLQKTISLIQSLINLNSKIVVCSDEQDYKIKQQIKQYPMELLDINAKKISLSLNNFNKLQFKPNIFIFDSVQSEEKYSAFLYNRWNKAARVLAINQLKGLEKWRKVNYKLVPNVLIPPDSYLSPQNIQQIFTQQQIHSISRCDYIFTSNQHTYHLLNKYILKDKSTKYISQINYGFPLVQFMGQITQLRYRPYKNRQHFIFIGNFYNQSNQDCVFVLVNYIWPVIREQLPGVELHIYGTGGVTQQHYFKQFGQPANFSKESLKKLGIYFKGIMKDPQSLSQYRALLYPCVFSTGTHMKVLQSWFTHLPVVTTPIGAQGLFLQSYDPQFVGSFNSKTSYIFSSQRVYTQQQKKNAEMIKNYYNNRIINKNSLKFKFGGSYANFTYKDFIENSIKIYKDQQYWKQCLKNAHEIIKTNQNDTHLQVVLKRALVSIEIATYEGRGRASYEEQWKRYTRSHEFNKKIRG